MASSESTDAALPFLFLAKMMWPGDPAAQREAVAAMAVNYVQTLHAAGPEMLRRSQTNGIGEATREAFRSAALSPADAARRVEDMILAPMGGWAALKTSPSEAMLVEIRRKRARDLWRVGTILAIAAALHRQHGSAISASIERARVIASRRLDADRNAEDDGGPWMPATRQFATVWREMRAGAPLAAGVFCVFQGMSLPEEWRLLEISHSAELQARVYSHARWYRDFAATYRNPQAGSAGGRKRGMPGDAMIPAAVASDIPDDVQPIEPPPMAFAPEDLEVASLSRKVRARRSQSAP